MKKLLIAAAIILTAATLNTAAASGNDKVSYKVLQSFANEFGNVEAVNWSETSSQMMKANFTKEGQTLNAFFNHDGEYIATTANMQAEQLPQKVRTNLEKKAPGMTITEVFELQSPEENAFFISTQNGDVQKVFKAYRSGYISEYSKATIK